jgi:phosphate starvation-inducible PhoH-like protein
MLMKKADGKPIYPETFTQDLYVRTIDQEELIFGVGPAGTGKTYLAVAMAVKHLKQNKINKLILTRPAVEAGEYLGYLPGDLKEKIDPYLRPLYDALYDFLGLETTNKLLESGVIEIAPLAYMRGKTLENAFIILDEAQNTTTMQMKMFLTRLGFNSTMVITGDPSQVDLPSGRKSGLIQALEILKDVPNIKVVRFKRLDVVRNPLVQKILERYDNL